MSCSTQDVDDSAAHVLAFSEGKKGDNVLSQSVSAGQGTILTPHQLAFEDESAMQGFGDLESSLHLMDTRPPLILLTLSCKLASQGPLVHAFCRNQVMVQLCMPRALQVKWAQSCRRHRQTSRHVLCMI